MKHEINPRETRRAYAFEMWMKAPMPMVTFFKTLDVNHLVRMSKRRGLKFNMLMCWCIGKAASTVKEFYLLPEGDKLMQFDSLAVCTIVANKQGEVSSCDVPFCEDLSAFNEQYLKLTEEVAETCRNHDLPDSMVIGTSALAQYDIDGAVGMYSGIFNNPFLIWAKYKPSFGQSTNAVSSGRLSRSPSSSTTPRWMGHKRPVSSMNCKGQSSCFELFFIFDVTFCLPEALC